MKTGWKESTLGEVLGVLRNGVNCKQNKSGDGDKISRIESISDAIFDLEKVGYAELSERDKERYLLQSGDILFSHINSAVHIGKTALFDSSEPVYHGVNLLLMRPTDEVTPAYLNHALKYLFQTGYWRGACKQSVNQASVNQQDISKVEIRYPKSLPEQQRIVGILDKAFESLATAKANAEKNLKNARAIFESELNAVFTQKGDDWVERTFEEIIQSNVIGLTKSFREQGANLQYPYVKMNNITRDNRFDFSSFVSVNATADEVSRFRLQEGDLIFNTRNSVELVGKACLFESGSNDVVLFNNNIMRIRFKSGIDPHFVLFSFSSNSVAEELNALKSGTTNVSAIYYKNLRDLAIPLAPLETQRAVALKLRHLREETQRLEGIYQRKLERLDALKKSLLHHAFTSQL